MENRSEELLKQVLEIFKKEGWQLSANDYDRLSYPKPNRQTVERHTGLKWGEMKEYLKSHEPTYEPEQGNAIRLMGILKTRKALRFTEIMDMFGCSIDHVQMMLQDLEDQGVELIRSDDSVAYAYDRPVEVEPLCEPISDAREVTFGVASDLHFGSKACQITALNEFCRICRKNGVKDIFHPGDMFAGYGVYPGQIQDLYAFSSDEQEESALVNIPHGFTWYLLGGNHDYSLIKIAGHNPIKAVCQRRKDFVYIGFDQAAVPILRNVDAVLWHPSGGVPYSLSYRLQKGVEQLAFDELLKTVRGVQDKPRVRFLFSGHLHVQLQALFGSIMGMQCGCFEGQTNYLKRKGLVPAIGGYIVCAEIGRSGLLRNFQVKFYVFEEAEDDWKNYKHSLPVSSGVEVPVFE